MRPVKDWARVNLAWFLGVVFLAGTLVATWGIHLRNASAHVSFEDRSQWQRIEDKVDALDEQLEEELAELRNKDCLLAYAIDFPDSSCETFFEWLDNHPRVQEQIRNGYGEKDNGGD